MSLLPSLSNYKASQTSFSTFMMALVWLPADINTVRSLYSATQLLVMRLQLLMARPPAGDVVMAEAASPPVPTSTPSQVTFLKISCTHLHFTVPRMLYTARLAMSSRWSGPMYKKQGKVLEDAWQGN